MLRVLALSGSGLRCGSCGDWRTNRCGPDLHTFQFASQRISLHLIQLGQQVVLALLSGAGEQFLPFLNLLHIFSHLVLEVGDAVDVHLGVHASDGLVARSQAIHHIDISVGGLDGHFLLLEHDLLAVKLG